MKTLIIDNYDSFTYNLVNMVAELNQQDPLVVRNDEAIWTTIAQYDFNNIIVSPGPGRPDRDRDFGLSREAILLSKVPLLGVCLGHQGIGVLNGGIVSKAPEPMHGRLSNIQHTGTGIFKGIPSPFQVARYHSLIVERPLPSMLLETAHTDDGLIMGVQHLNKPQWGVQFHPESIITDHGSKLLKNFRDLTLFHQGGNGRSYHIPFKEVVSKEEAVSELKAFWEEIPFCVDAEATFTNLFLNKETAFWLDSSLVEAHRSRWSYLGDSAGPEAEVIRYYCQDKRLEIETATGRRILKMSIFDYLGDRSFIKPQNPPPCPFTGGYVGWFGYELRRDCASLTLRNSSTPDAFLIRSRRFIAIDHVEQRSYIIAIDQASEEARATSWIAETVAKLMNMKTASAQISKSHSCEPVRFYLDRDRQTYLNDIQQCLEWIGQGETYQVCLTNEIYCDINSDPFELYRTMRRINPAPYAAFLHWPGGAILSASPERFLSLDTNGLVETKPIKGTIRRDPDAVKDKALSDALQRSYKDRAENVMIVDLLRNDLSRVCEPGSVVVPKLFSVETYATVHQLVSTVRGMLRPGMTIVDLLLAAFPGGSMTGAPKIRTMELIDQLEKRARGIYSGALGWVGDDGAADLSIVIRTIVATKGRYAFGVGGGIVTDSTLEGEYSEMMLKAQASIRSIVSVATGGSSQDNFVILDGPESRKQNGLELEFSKDSETM